MTKKSIFNKRLFSAGTALQAVALLGAGVSLSAPAMAQSADDVGTAEAEDTSDAIVVTGSRIARRQFDSAAPVAVVSSEEFKLTGAVNVEQVINTLPQVVPGTTAFSNNPGGGVATLNLRGLGTSRTLVLLNGRRYLSFDASQIVDLNTIPQFLLDGVDAVTGGASAVYGSDAISGVVNFRLDENLTGLRAGAQYSITEEGDGRRLQTYAAIGGSFDDNRGHIVAYGEYYKRKPIFQGARDFSRFTLGESGGVLVPAGSATVPQGRISIARTAQIDNPTDLNGDGDVLDPGEVPTANLAAGNFENAFFGTPGTSTLFRDPEDRYNFAPDNYLQVPQERFLAGAYGSYEISDAVTAFMEVAFTNNRVSAELAPTPVGVTLNLNLANIAQYLSAADLAALQQVDANETAINATRATNGLAPLFGASAAAGLVQASVARRTSESGSRHQLDERNAFRVLAGVRGPVTETFNYEAYYSYARTRNAQVQEGNISRSAFIDAVESGAINIFGPNTLSQADVDSISILAQNGEVSVLQVASGNISGTFGNFGLGADDIGIAVGAEWRSQHASFIPDTALSSGDVIGFNAGDPTSGGYEVTEIFGELRVPIIADSVFAHRLELTGAVRYSDYSLGAVGDVWSYAGGIEWAPIRDITFRAQYQRATRAPNVQELFGGQFNNFPGATDPCSDRQPVASRTQAVQDLCVATGVPAGLVFTPGIQPNAQIQVLQGGNPNLGEETSDSYTVGAVLRPSFVPGLNVSVDYFHIKIEDYISSLGGGLGGTLDLCYNVLQDINSVYCQAIANGGRDSVTGIIGDNNQLPLIAGANVAKDVTSGIDVQVDYSRPLGFGLFGKESKLNFSFLGTYTIKNEFFAVQQLNDSTDCAGAFGNSICGTPQPEYKWTSRLSWLDGPLTTSLRWRHVGASRDDDDGTDYFVERLGRYDVFDLTLSADVNDNLNMTFGVNNLFDKRPQLLGDNQQQSNTFPSVYDVLGRDFFVSANLRF